MYQYANEKYIIFLNDNFFKKSWFKSYYNRIITNLENKGIKIVSKSSIYEYQSSNPSIKVRFDDNMYPITHCLYIHLFNGNYYNDTIYVKKKIDIEREMLILLAGKLGVKDLKYSSIVTETIFHNISASITAKGIKNMVKYTRDNVVKEGVSGCETYLNRGAPVYIYSRDLKEIDTNIKTTLGTMNSNIFSYEFYKQNPKLESFVYKRFEFKMLHLEYTIEVEDISEKSFAIKSCFMDYGLGLSIDKNTSYNETINYKFDFFTDQDLRIQLLANQRLDADQFIVIREAYNASDNKDLAVEYICEYVKIQATNYEYSSDDESYTANCHDALSTWINYTSHDEFVKICHTFVSTVQIKSWIYNNLIKNNTSNILMHSTKDIINNKNEPIQKLNIDEDSNLDIKHFPSSPTAKVLKKPHDSPQIPNSSDESLDGVNNSSKYIAENPILIKKPKRLSEIFKSKNKKYNIHFKKPSSAKDDNSRRMSPVRYES